MNEKTTDDVGANNNVEHNTDASEKLEQEQKTKISVKEVPDDKEVTSDEKSSENKEANKDEDSIDTIDSLKKELSENKDRLLRSLAESENTRKQMEKIRIETSKYGVQPLAREILNVVDNFNRALSLKDDNNEKGLEEGLNLIQKEILGILEKFNIKKIQALGEDFNANYHQAMFEKETNEFEVGKVCEIVQDGYTFHDRLLRPALVGVAKKSNENNEDEKIEDNENKKNEEKN